MNVVRKFLQKTALWILLAPLSLGFLGVASNQLVLNANHDTFPVMWNDEKVGEYAVKLQQLAADEDPDIARVGNVRLAALERGYIDNTHVIMTSKTHLNWLADVFDMHSATYSIGDFFLMLGEELWPYALVVWGVVVSSANCFEIRG